MGLAEEYPRVVVDLDHEVWARIWAKVTFPPNLTDCWLWHGACSTKRRGQRRPHIKLAGKMQSVGRLVCATYNGPPPTPEHEAGHICPKGETDTCINPQHFKWQTREENEQWKHHVYLPESGGLLAEGM